MEKNSKNIEFSRVDRWHLTCYTEKALNKFVTFTPVWQLGGTDSRDFHMMQREVGQEMNMEGTECNTKG